MKGVPRSSPPPVVVIHQMRGRVRLHVPVLKWSRPRLDSLHRFLEGLPGIEQRVINLNTCSVLLTFDPRAATADGLRHAVLRWQAEICPLVGADPAGGPQAGAAVAAVGRCGSPACGREAFQPRELALPIQVGLSAAASLVALASLVEGALFGSPRWTNALAAATTLVTGYPIFRAGLEGIIVERKLNNDLLITVATLVAVAVGEGWTGLIVVALVNLSNLFQTLTLDRSKRAIREMLLGSERRAMLLIDGAEVEVPVAQVQPGDTVVVRTGEKIPVDGIVVYGHASVNQAAITGESMPVARAVGDRVCAGTLLEMGYLHVLSERTGDDTTVGRIVRMVEEASAVKAPIQQLAERFADRFVPLSLGAALLFFLLTGDLQRTMTILIVACPCAAGLSTPTAVAAALGNAAGRGALVKGGNHLEAMGQVDAVLFDKTGTLTEGRPEVSRVISFSPGYHPEEVLSLAAAAEGRATHPLARAVLAAAERRGLPIPPVEEHAVVIGQGVRAVVGGEVLLVGSQRLLAGHAIPTAPAAPVIRHLEEQGQTVLWVAYGGSLIGCIAAADRLRPESASAIRQLESVGMAEIAMLSGDSQDVSERVGAALGLSKVYGELLPGQKVDVVRALQREGRIVAMVGEGINDSPALAAAHVGIAMGTGGTDVAIEAADIVLAGDDPRKVAGLVVLSRRTLQVIRQNFGLAIGINAVGLGLGLLRLISPLTAAIVHNLATLGVVLNSSQLLFYREWAADEAAVVEGPPEPVLAEEDLPDGQAGESTA